MRSRLLTGVSALTVTVAAHSLACLTICAADPEHGEELKPQLRGLSSALAFCCKNSLEFIRGIGVTSGAYAVELCAILFGRDEVDSSSGFLFQQKQVDQLLNKWIQVTRKEGFWARSEPKADLILVKELCVSDANKPLLLSNPKFIPYLVDGLLLDPEHPRKDMAEAKKAWLQTEHAECFAQLAMFDGAQEALQNAEVVAALQKVAAEGWEKEGRDSAQAALTALVTLGDETPSPKSSRAETMSEDGCLQMHVMLSCKHSTPQRRLPRSLSALKLRCRRPMGCAADHSACERLPQKARIRNVVRS